MSKNGCHYVDSLCFASRGTGDICVDIAFSADALEQIHMYLYGYIALPFIAGKYISLCNYETKVLSKRSDVKKWRLLSKLKI